jgi:hypothetical protein
VAQLLLLGGLVWSFVSLWVSAKKNSKKTKILSVVEEPTAHHRQVEISNQPKRPMNHLFDELEE